MDIKELINLQLDFDASHGFPTQFASEQDKYQQLNKDVIGLMGEIGEFSNILKKINLYLDRQGEYRLDVVTAEIQMKEELIDSFIYLIRLAAILQVDLDSELQAKIKKNIGRYRNLEK